MKRNAPLTEVTIKGYKSKSLQKGGTKQAMELTVVNLELKNKLQTRIRSAGGSLTAGSRILWLWKLWNKTRVMKLITETTHWHETRETQTI